jgi:hypothetical protein
LITDGEVHKMNTCSESRAELTAITTPRWTSKEQCDPLSQHSRVYLWVSYYSQRKHQLFPYIASISQLIVVTKKCCFLFAIETDIFKCYLHELRASNGSNTYSISIQLGILIVASQ